MNRKVFILFLSVFLVGSLFSGTSDNFVKLKKKIPFYLNTLDRIASDVANHKDNLQELITGVSTASMLVQILDNKNDKLKAARLGVLLSKELMNKYPKRVEGYYYGGMLLGMIGVYKGAQYILNYLPKIESWVKTAVNLDPSFHNGAPYILLCATYFESPGFPVSIGDIYKARKYCELAVKKYPKNCTSYLFLAAIYDTLGEPKKSLFYLNKGEKYCEPVLNTLEEKVWNEKDLESIKIMKEKLKRGESLKKFMEER